ncbi:hypothetical protein SY88_13975 [Clostridiales bacterium PH28_bin88]|nr:hypothetical protein SY88_13975 [Clostridiales bacterium PH28_bin88]
MTLGEVQKILEARVIWGDEYLDREVSGGFASDLMSDYLVFAKPKGLLLTGLIHSQVVRTAEIIDAQAVVFVRGKLPEGELVELAKEKGIPVMTTDKLLFDSCGLLFLAGLRGA